MSWKIPPAVQAWPDLFKGYRVYVTAAGESKPAAVVDVPRPVDDFTKNPVEIDPVALKITAEQQKKGLQVQVATVTREGLVAQTSPTGGKEPLESERSDAASAPAGGTISVVVHEPKPDKIPTNPFEVLGGTPTPGASVTCRYTWQGKNVSLTATTNKYGTCRFTAVPFGVAVTIEIQVGVRKESKTITLLPQQPDAGVEFGWMGHEARASGGVSIPPNAPAPKPK